MRKQDKRMLGGILMLIGFILILLGSGIDLTGIGIPEGLATQAIGATTFLYGLYKL